MLCSVKYCQSQNDKINVGTLLILLPSEVITLPLDIVTTSQ